MASIQMCAPRHGAQPCLGVRVGCEVLVGVLDDAMVPFSRLVTRVYVDGDIRKVGQVMQESMPDLHGDGVTFD